MLEAIRSGDCNGTRFDHDHVEEAAIEVGQQLLIAWPEAAGAGLSRAARPTAMTSSPPRPANDRCASAAGRKPGVRNKFVTELKEAFLQAAEDVGEVEEEPIFDKKGRGRRRKSGISRASFPG
jgi:hypothetical protein